MPDREHGALTPRFESPVLSLRFDDEVRVLTHHNTTVHVFSEAYQELSHVVHRPSPESPDVVLAFGRPRLVERLRAEWFPTIINRCPPDSMIDAYVQHSSRHLDRELRSLE